MTNGTTTIEQVEAELARMNLALEELAVSAAELGDTEFSLGEDESVLFERLASLDCEATPAVALPTFAVAV